MIDRPNILLALLIPGFRMGRTGFVVGLTLATLLVLISLIGEEFYWNVDWLFAGGCWDFGLGSCRSLIASSTLARHGCGYCWPRFLSSTCCWLVGFCSVQARLRMMMMITPPLSPWAQATAMAGVMSPDDGDGDNAEPQAEPAWRPTRAAEPVLSQNVEAVERTRPMDTDDAVQRL